MIVVTQSTGEVRLITKRVEGEEISGKIYYSPVEPCDYYKNDSWTMFDPNNNIEIMEYVGNVFILETPGIDSAIQQMYCCKEHKLYLFKDNTIQIPIDFDEYGDINRFYDFSCQKWIETEHNCFKFTQMLDKIYASDIKACSNETMGIYILGEGWVKNINMLAIRLANAEYFERR